MHYITKALATGGSGPDIETFQGGRGVAVLESPGTAAAVPRNRERESKVAEIKKTLRE